MSVHGHQYVPDSGQSGHERLRTIGEIHDDRMRALLLGAGLAAGDRYVEFGCGLGTRRDSRSFASTHITRTNARSPDIGHPRPHASAGRA
jgi:hypothetical protein